MGGQACVLYGGAEFSRDLDLAIEADEENLEKVRWALERLQAEQVFVPQLGVEQLMRGHACHFRAHATGAEDLRIDLMARMRGCPDFPELWDRRAIVDSPAFGEIPVLSLVDLVRAKKTQRGKDWPMIRLLIEADMLRDADNPDPDQGEFWMQECRTPTLLVDLARREPDLCQKVRAKRPLLERALDADIEGLEHELTEEEAREREADKAYWRPLKEELEMWRRELVQRQRELEGEDS
jgi:hypothetical protein